MSSFISLQKDILGTTQQLTSLNELTQENMIGELDIYYVGIIFSIN